MLQFEPEYHQLVEFHLPEKKIGHFFKAFHCLDKAYPHYGGHSALLNVY